MVARSKRRQKNVRAPTSIPRSVQYVSGYKNGNDPAVSTAINWLLLALWVSTRSKMIHDEARMRIIPVREIINAAKDPSKPMR
jgi:hypothetical protein